MADDCYKKFKTVYNQAVADGLPTAAAQLAAQSAMSDCLSQQSVVTPAVLPTVTTVPEPTEVGGGTTRALDRAARLGTRGK
jgi:hypothetical protein